MKQRILVILILNFSVNYCISQEDTRNIITATDTIKHGVYHKYSTGNGRRGRRLFKTYFYQDGELKASIQYLRKKAMVEREYNSNVLYRITFFDEKGRLKYEKVYFNKVMYRLRIYNKNGILVEDEMHEGKM